MEIGQDGLVLRRCLRHSRGDNRVGRPGSDRSEACGDDRGRSAGDHRLVSTGLVRGVDAYDRIAEESLGMGDPEFHEIEERLFDAIDDSDYRAVIKNGDIYIPDPNGLPGEIIVVDPAEPEDLDDPTVLNLDED